MWVDGGRHDEAMAISRADFELTMDELRVVARYAAESAAVILDLFEEVAPNDPRPREAIEAAYVFARGAGRTRLQRVTAVAAHRAAREVPDEAAQHAARAAGDAAAAAYLHPLATASQVGHILGAAASAARAAELRAGDDPAVAEAFLEQARERAAPLLVDVLRRYPRAPIGKTRVAKLVTTLDSSLRTPR